MGIHTHKDIIHTTQLLHRHTRSRFHSHSMQTDRVLRSSRRPNAAPTPTPVPPKSKNMKNKVSETPTRSKKETVKVFSTPDLPDMSTLVINTKSKTHSRKRLSKKAPDAAENLKTVKKRGRPRKTPIPSKITVEVPKKLIEKME